MTLPHAPITPIPNDEPEATPSLWNFRYAQIDYNFLVLDERVTITETELIGARGGKASVGARLDQMASDIGATSVDMQNSKLAALKYAIDQSALANYGVRALREQAQQQGEFTIQNRGIVSGCTVSKSGTAARNLNLIGGVCFANGRAYSVADSVNTASVPSNPGAGSATAYAYLYPDSNGQWRLAVTPLGTAVPAGSITIYNLVIPAASTDITDPNLTGVTLTDTRRIESEFPQLLNNPANVSPVLQTLSANDYHLEFDVIAYLGSSCSERSIVVSSRATNGFTVQLASASDNVIVRWKVSKLNN